MVSSKFINDLSSVTCVIGLESNAKQMLLCIGILQRISRHVPTLKKAIHSVGMYHQEKTNLCTNHMKTVVVHSFLELRVPRMTFAHKKKNLAPNNSGEFCDCTLVLLWGAKLVKLT